MSTALAEMKDKIGPLRAAIDAALAQVGEQFDLDIKLSGNASYTEGGINLKLYAAVAGSSKMAEDFKLYCDRYRLSPDDLGKEFSFNGERVTLLGAKPRSRTYPLVVKRASGESCRISPRSLIKV